MKKTWASICKAAEIEGLRVHDLRHSFASQLVSSGASLPLIGALLGHTNPTTTHRYAHLYDDPQRAAVERVGAIFTRRWQSRCSTAADPDRSPQAATMTKFVYRRRTVEHVRAYLSRRTAQEVWHELEGEHGGLRAIPDDDLKQHITTRQHIAEIIGDGGRLRVPPVVATRMFEDMLAKARRRRAALSDEDWRKLTEAKKMLAKLKASLPRRPAHRPRRKDYGEIVGEFRGRRYELRARLTSAEATEQAANEIGRLYGLSPATVVSVAKNPGRLRRRRQV